MHNCSLSGHRVSKLDEDDYVGDKHGHELQQKKITPLYIRCLIPGVSHTPCWGVSREDCTVSFYFFHFIQILLKHSI